MTDNTAELTLAEQATRLAYMPWGPAHREAAAAVVAAAQERDDLDAEFAGRMRLTAEGAMSGITELALANFAWCAAKHAEDPERFVGDVDDPSDTIFWQYKWMPALLRGSPAFSSAQIDEVLADFDATYRKAGLPRSAVVGAQFENALGMGRIADAVRLGELAANTPRDDFSSCAACTPSNFVDLALLTGDEAKAIEVAVKTWRDGESCAEEPESMLATVLLPLLRAGRTKEAVEAYELVYAASRSEADQVDNHSYAALFASVTGNHQLALTLVERHLSGLGHGALRERDQLAAGLNFAVVLERFAAARTANVAVRASTATALQGILPDAGRPLTVPELAEVLWGLATDLAARFDERNGTDYWGQRLARSRSEVSEEHPLELTDAEDFTAILVLPDEPASPVDWVWRAVDCLWTGDLSGVVEAAQRALAHEAELSLAARLRAHGALCSAAELADNVSEFDQAFAAYVEVVTDLYGEHTAAFTRATHPGASPAEIAAAFEAYPSAAVGPRLRAVAVELRSVVNGDDEPDPADLRRLEAQFRAGLEQLEDELATATDPDERYSSALSVAAARQQLAQVYFALQDVDAAIAAATAGVEAAPSRVVQAAIVTMAGNMLGRAGDAAAAAERFDNAATLYSARGFVRNAVYAALDAATAWSNAEEPDAAAVRFDFAQSLLRDDQELPVGARWTWALALLDAGEADRAVPLLEAILAGELGDPQTEPGSLAQTYFRLARAYDDSYDARAGAHYREAITYFVADGAPLAGVQAATYACREFRFQERWSDAIAVAEDALGLLVTNPEPALEFEIVKQLADAQAQSGDETWRSRADQLLEVASRIDDPEAMVDAMGTRAVMEFEFGEHAAVLPLAQATLDAALAGGNYGTAVASVWYLASSLAELGRVDDAIAVLERYRARADEFGDERESLGGAGANLLERLGRDDLAAQWAAYFGLTD